MYILFYSMRNLKSKFLASLGAFVNDGTSLDGDLPLKKWIIWPPQCYIILAIFIIRGQIFQFPNRHVLYDVFRFLFMLLSWKCRLVWKFNCRRPIQCVNHAKKEWKMEHSTCKQFINANKHPNTVNDFLLTR